MCTPPPGVVRAAKKQLRPTNNPNIQVTQGHQNTFMVDPEQLPNDAKCCFWRLGRRRLPARALALATTL